MPKGLTPAQVDELLKDYPGADNPFVSREAMDKRIADDAKLNAARVVLLQRALERARAWGIAHKGYHAFVAGDLADWVDGGMDSPLPEITSPLVKSAEAAALEQAENG